MPETIRFHIDLPAQGLLTPPEKRLLLPPGASKGTLITLEEFDRENVVPLAKVMETAPNAAQYIDFADVLERLRQEKGGRSLTPNEIHDALKEQAAGHSFKGEYVVILGRKVVGLVGVYPEPNTDEEFDGKPATDHAAGVHYLMGENARGLKLASAGSRAMHTILRIVHRDNPTVMRDLTAVYTINPDNFASQRVATAVGAEKDPRWFAEATSGAPEEGYSVELTDEALARNALREAGYRKQLLIKVHR